MNGLLAGMSFLLLGAGPGDDYTRADQKLNAVYREVLRSYADDPTFVKRLKAAQRAWLAFRDAELAALYPRAQEPGYYGSIYPACFATAKADLTKRRAEELRRWLDGVAEGDVCAGSVRTKPTRTPSP
jgi:uncharacterized protein YecT (DUF1311 family)